jgi:hypothetical protein
MRSDPKTAESFTELGRSKMMEKRFKKIGIKLDLIEMKQQKQLYKILILPDVKKMPKVVSTI